MFRNLCIRGIIACFAAVPVVALLPSQSFSQLALGRNKFVGNIMHDPANPPSNFAQYWDQVTPENAGKWGSVQGSDTSSYNWTQLDETYNYANSNGFPFKDHNMIWGSQQPGFMMSGVLDSAQQYRAIDRWIDSCAHRYPLAAFCDVVNEPIHTAPNGANGTANYIGALGGAGTTGWDWVINAYTIARKYWSSNTKLLINEYGIVSSQSTTATYLKIIRLLQARKLIDGIGVQAHSFSVQGTSPTVMRQNLDSLATTGLPIYISELDINDQSDQTQLQDYESIFPVLYQFPDVKGITLWGYQQGQTWETYTYLLNSNGTERPALQWLSTYLTKYLLMSPLVSPVDSTGIVRNPLVVWHSSIAASSYHLQVSTDDMFSTTAVDSTVADTTLQLDTLKANTKYYWRVEAFNASDTGDYSSVANFVTDDSIMTGVKVAGEIPRGFALSQNYPNPFNPSTVIGYQLPAVSHVTLKVYDVLGREAATLVNEKENAGYHTVTFNAGNLPSGLYFYRMQASNYSETKKLLLIK